MTDRKLHKAGLVTIGAVLGAVVALALIFVMSILKGVQTESSNEIDQSSDELLNASDSTNPLLSSADRSSNISVASAIRHPEAAWEVLVRSGSGVSQLETLLKVAQFWIEKDGIQVIDQIGATLSATTVREAVIASVLQSVASADPQMALQQALGLEGVSRQLALQTIIEVWATADPQAALAGVSVLESKSDRRTLQETILRVWANINPQGLLEAVESLPENLRKLGLEEALLVISRDTPEEAVRLIADLTDRDLLDKLSKEIATYWSEQDPRAALDWVLNNHFPTNVIQAEALMIVLGNLAKEDPDLAFQTARDQPIVLRGQHYRGLEVTVIQQLVEHDIDAAMEMLAQIRNEGLTVAHAYSEVGRAFIRNGEFDRALKLGERLSERGQRNYNGALMYQWAMTEPESLFSAIEGLPNDLIREQAARGLMRYNPETYALSDEQLQQIAAYLPEGYVPPGSIPDGDGGYITPQIFDDPTSVIILNSNQLLDD